MAIRWLTDKQHRDVLESLVRLAKSAEVRDFHPAGPEYTSLMICFLMHSTTAAESLIRLHDCFGDDYFPTTVGYVIVRPMFEIDVTAHYITLEPTVRSRQYIEYEAILKKNQMDACQDHRKSPKQNWQEAMNQMWNGYWAPMQARIQSKYLSVRPQFMRATKKGSSKAFINWCDKSIRQMAEEVNHKEAYDLFYADLSSFTHADVRLANAFLRLDPSGMSWSTKARSPNFGFVFRYADIFLDCLLCLFGREFRLWPEEQVEQCWETNT